MLRLIHTFCKYAYSLNQNTLFNITNNHLPLISSPSGRLLVKLRKNSQAQQLQTEVFKTHKKKMDDQVRVTKSTDEIIILNDDTVSISSDDEDITMEHCVQQDWDPVPRDSHADISFKAGVQFRVLSYNILSQELLESHPQLYKKCQFEHLKWAERRKKIMNEISLSQPDIVCLQEVQWGHYKEIAKNLIGFFSLYKKKKEKIDGCAIFYRTSKFDMIDQMSVEFHQKYLPVLNRDNVAILMKLVVRDLPKSIPLVVVNTHLLFNRSRDDVRMAQLKLLLAELDRFAFYEDDYRQGYLPTIITGDFNSRPNSLLVKAMTLGIVNDRILHDGLSDWRRISITDKCQHFAIFINRSSGYRASNFRLTRITHTNYPFNNMDGRIQPECRQYSKLFNKATLEHTFNLRSVYDIDKDIELATTFQQQWVMVDYIFFSKCANLQLLDRLRLPTVQQCSEMPPLPNHEHGSDHFAIGATFCLFLP